MEHIKRKILCVGVLAALLLSVALTGVAVSQPVQNGNAMGKVAQQGLTPDGAAGEISMNKAMRVPIRVVHSGHGFALNENEFHVLRVHIVRARHVQPAYLRGLMEANKSIEQIRAEIEGAEGQQIYRGNLRLGVNHYRLANISVTASGDDQVVNADVMERGENGGKVGTISVTTKNYERTRIGDGTLTMSGGQYPGEYRALLDVLPPRPILRRPILQGQQE